MINRLKQDWLIVAILLFALVLRLWNLNNVPPHLTPDEAALGYNAYSILKTGRDEHGKFLPIVFKSFGDYKPGLYIYTTIPFVATLGLNEWSVRLPSVLFGVIIVYLIYLVSGKLFRDSHLDIPIYTAALAACTPWLIYFSRGAWEVNLSLMLTLLGVYFFLKTLDSSKYIIHSAFFFALTLPAYQGAKLSTGIVVLILVFLYWKEFWNIEKKYLTKSALLGFVVIVPIIISLFTGQTGRLEVFSVFSYPRSEEYIQNMLNEGNEKIGGVKYYLYHPESLNFLRGIMGRWFNHFSGRFLFFEGDFANPRHSSPYQGMLLLGDLLALLVGAYVLLKDKISKEKFFIILWLMVAPLPAILSRDQVHAVRSINMAIPLIMISGMGLSYVVTNFKKIKYLFLVFYFLTFIYFVDSYFIHLPKHSSKLWEYGYKQIVETVSPIQNDYEKVVVQQSFAQPYIYFLFFNKYDPRKWQLENNYVESEYKFDVGYVTRVDNVYFEAIDWSRNRGDHGNLFVADTLRIPPGDSIDDREFRLIKEIKYLDNLNTAFRILEVKNK